MVLTIRNLVIEFLEKKILKKKKTILEQIEKEIYAIPDLLPKLYYDTSPPMYETKYACEQTLALIKARDTVAKLRQNLKALHLKLANLSNVFRFMCKIQQRFLFKLLLKETKEFLSKVENLFIESKKMDESCRELSAKINRWFEICRLRAIIQRVGIKEIEIM